jgi:hypothetical protein
MFSKKALVTSILLTVVPVSQVLAQSTNVSNQPASTNLAASPVATGSSDCSNGFFSRFADAYREDAQPSTSSSPAPARRAMDAPLDSPPFPSSEWQLGGIPTPIGVPDTDNTYPLEKALGCTAFGQWMQRNRIELYGWATPSANLSTSNWTNAPLSYNTRANRFEFDQLVTTITRVEDTVQTDHMDWGFDISNLWGYDYHYTTMKGVFSNQLLNNPSTGEPQSGKLYGDDPMLFYGDIYIPWVAEGMVVRIGRWLSLPDIEAQFSPQNYLMTHSILYTVDPYTQMGVMTTTRLNQQWTFQIGVNASNDTAVWNHAARPSLQTCVRWVSADNDDMLYPCVNNWNKSDYNYNNVQMYVATWGHKFSNRVHMLTEAYRMYGRNIPGYGPGGTPGQAGSSEFAGTAGEFGVVNYLNFELNSNNMLSFRNEFYNDEKGQRTGYATRYSSHTLGITHYVTQDLEIQPEIRYEHSYDCDAYNGGNRDYQFVALIDTIIHY